jgi:HD-GYP domain-containing protein (c-di-GMP phosphodiesterase class II)
MDKRHVSMADLVIGQALRWDILDEHGGLLLSKGHIIESQHLIDELISRGLFFDAPHIAPKVVHTEAKVKELPSVVHFINLASKRLEHLLFSLHLEQDAQAKILEVAKTIIFAVNLNHDIALACMMVNRAMGNFTIRHSVDTAILSQLVAQAMKKTPDEIQSIVAAALTMNVGMLRQHNQLQSKAEPLTESEWEMVHKHPEESVNLLKQAGIKDEAWLSYVLHHHENENGTGYPFKKSGQDIPQSAKIISISDIYCARVTERDYRKPLLPSVALRGLFVDESKIIDTHLAPYFIQELGLYPPGCCVRLHNGELGIVTQKGHTPTTPIVHAHIGPRGAPLSFPIRRDTTKELYKIDSLVQADDAPLQFSMQQLWGSEAAV